MNEVEWMERYEGSVLHRTWLLFRGLLGLILVVPLLVMTLLLCVIELGNRLIDAITETDEDSELS